MWLQLLKIYGPTNTVSEVLSGPIVSARVSCLSLQGLVNLAAGESFQLVVANQGGGSMLIECSSARVSGHKIN